jgi:hypothetical protein
METPGAWPPRAWPPDLRRMEGGMPLRRRVWWLQRLAWAAMGILVLAALAGSFGGGPLASADHVASSETSAASWAPCVREVGASAEAGGLHARWRRVQRLGTEASMQLTLPALPGAAEADLLLDPGFLQGWRLRGLAPAPLAAATGSAGLRLTLRRDPAGEASLMLQAEPVGWPGLRRLRVQAGAQTLDLPVLVSP